MFNLFTAFFGGMYYGSKSTYEKGKLKKYDDNQKIFQDKLSRIRAIYSATSNHTQMIKEKILSGRYYEVICDRYEEDFRYVFGSNWKERLSIPPKPPVLNPAQYKSDAYSFYVPANHICWVYHLMLADEGKLDNWIISPVNGFSCGGENIIDMNIKFVKRIEMKLINRGVNDIRFVIKPDSCWAQNPWEPVPKPYSKREMCGGKFIIEALADKEYTDRIW